MSRRVDDLRIEVECRQKIFDAASDALSITERELRNRQETWKSSLAALYDAKAELLLAESEVSQ